MKERYDLTQLPLVAQTLVADLDTNLKGATQAVVVGLSGDLGAGKTTLVKEIAIALGVQEVVVSPTFVVAKFYEVRHPHFDTLVHMDAYRIESVEELAPLGWEILLQQPRTLIIIEWPERIIHAIPQNMALYTLTHDDQYRIISNEKIN